MRFLFYFALIFFQIAVLTADLSALQAESAWQRNSPDHPKISSGLISDGLNKPVYLTALEGDSTRLYILEQKGVIRIIQKGKLIQQPFLDITDRVHNPLTPGDERGLLGMAFTPAKIPGYSNTFEHRYFYLNYVDRQDYTIISRFSLKDWQTADPASEQVIFKIKQPYPNHNGGQLAFGPKDSFLYIGLGDGGSVGDPHNHAQNLNSFFGKILRIDVYTKFPYAIPKSNPYFNRKDALPEIWAYGLRNPWRFSFDRQTGDLYIGDVGQNSWEEIDFQPGSSKGGENYGWRMMEGKHCYNPPENCESSGLVFPIFEYPNDANYYKTLAGLPQEEVHGCSVTGGYVYRGKAMPYLQGTYFFADFCTGKIWSFKITGENRITEFKDRTEELNLGEGKKTHNVSSFGEDGVGELYIIDYNGAVFQIIENDSHESLRD